MTMEFIAISIYVVGLIGWYGVWSAIIGFTLLSKLKLLHFPFWGCQLVFMINIVLELFIDEQDSVCVAGRAGEGCYQAQLSLYNYVEANGTALASMSLAIAVFWVFVSKDKILRQSDVLVKLFLWLLFWAFLLSVVGTLPLYWMPTYGYWLPTLRHLKSVPYFYALFILASALVVFLYKLNYQRELAEHIPRIRLGNIQVYEPDETQRK